MPVRLAGEVVQAEHSAQQNQVCRDGIEVGIGLRRVVDEPRAAIAGIGRARLVKVLASEHPVGGVLDCAAAVLDLPGYRAVSILGALGGVENAVGHVQLRQVQQLRRTIPSTLRSVTVEPYTQPDNP